MTDQPNQNAGGERRYWLDDPRNVTKIVWALIVICLSPL